jgi:ribosomal protein S12 methylthiotransferase
MPVTAAPLGKIALLSLGCAKNLADSERLVGDLAAAGFALAPSLEQADLALVNTCGFIDPAKAESIDTILKVAAQKEFGRLRGLLVAGCLVERYAEQLSKEIPEVDRWLSFKDYGRVVDAARDLMGLPQVRSLPPQRVLLTPAAYAYLKISEGCDQKCTFCSIPSFRGRLKSRTIEENVADARLVAERGVGEINLVSQDTTAYGRDVYGKPRLADLLRELTQIEGPRWWRLLYLYPSTLREDVLDEIARNERIVKYIDMPVQHVNDRMLHAMKRGITGKRQRELLETIRRRIPGVTMRTTLIAGFPGETDAEHQEQVAFVREGWFDRLGVFTYCREEGTPSHDMADQVPSEVAEARKAELLEAQQSVHLARNRLRVGEEVEVLVESFDARAGAAKGRTPQDAPEVDGSIVVRGVRQVRPGAFVRARVVAADGYDLEAEPLGPGAT